MWLVNLYWINMVNLFKLNLILDLKVYSFLRFIGRNRGFFFKGVFRKFEKEGIIY